MAVVKTFIDGSYAEFSRGSFDNWCVYMNPIDGNRYAPVDVEYFIFFQRLAEKYSKQMVYNSFVEFYNLTSKTVDEAVLSQIESTSKKFGEEHLDVEKHFTVMYMGMIAEENKAFTKLGKRVKRLGFYQTVILGYSPQDAAFFLKEKNGNN